MNSTNDKRWYVQTPNGVQGPFTQQQLVAMVNKGTIDQSTLLQDEANQSWVRASQVPSIFIAKPSAGTQQVGRRTAPPPLPSVKQASALNSTPTSSSYGPVGRQNGESSILAAHPLRSPLIIGGACLLAILGIVGLAVMLVDSQHQAVSIVGKVEDTIQEDPFGDPEPAPGIPDSEPVPGILSSGSGFLISPQLVLTNRHVVLNDETQSPAGLRFLVGNEKIVKDLIDARVVKVSSDPEVDLALLMVDRPLNVSPIPIREAPPQEGEPLVVLGYPLWILGALEPKRHSSLGIVNSLSYQEKVFTHDAAANPGNSGGPCVDLKGNVIGVLNAVLNEDARSLGGSDRSFAVSNLEAIRFLKGFPGYSQLPTRANKREASEVIKMVGDAVLVILAFEQE